MGKEKEHEKYNQKNDDKMCQCGHTYYRHFDPQNNMKFVGCKFCGCQEFIEEITEKEMFQVMGNLLMLKRGLR